MDKKRDTRTRGERLREEGFPIYLPTVSSNTLYLIDHLFSAGPIQQSEMGAVPLSNQELEAWMKGTSTPLEPWEFQVIRNLSKAYLHEMMAGKEPSQAAPYIEVDQDVRDAVGRQVEGALRARALQVRAARRKQEKRNAKKAR